MSFIGIFTWQKEEGNLVLVREAGSQNQNTQRKVCSEKTSESKIPNCQTSGIITLLRSFVQNGMGHSQGPTLTTEREPGLQGTGKQGRSPTRRRPVREAHCVPEFEHKRIPNSMN